jgi:type II secretory pathway pseudopilin PulG
MRRNQKNRVAFTLVELLVAAALSLAIMLIIGVAFQKGIETFRLLRSVSQMQEKLKSAHMVLRRDLSAEHFGDLNSALTTNYSGRKLSQQRLDLNGWMPPQWGFFSIMQGAVPSSLSTGYYPTASTYNSNPPCIYENLTSDADGLPSTRAVTHTLHFTARLFPDPSIDSNTNNHEEDYFYAVAPATLTPFTPVDFARPSGNIFASQWAEVIYFVAPNGTYANGGGPTMAGPAEPLYTLYRRQRLLLPVVAPATPPMWSATLEQSYPDVSWSTNFYLVNQVIDIPVRQNRAITPTTAATTGPAQYVQPGNANATAAGYGTIWRCNTIAELTGSTSSIAGDDILLTDVLSFEVKVNWTDTQTATNALTGASLPFEAFSAGTNNPDWPFDYLPTSSTGTTTTANPRNSSYNDTTYPSRTFDTWSSSDGGVSGMTPAVVWTDNSNATGFNQPATTNEPPLRIRINSLQIRLRVWDANAQQARQITIVQDM